MRSLKVKDAHILELGRSLSLCLVSQKRDKEKIPEEEGDSEDGSHAAADQGMPGPMRKQDRLQDLHKKQL